MHLLRPAKLKYYRWLFLTAAAWNWLVSLLSLLGDQQIRSALGMAPSTDSLNLHLAISCIWLLGIGYYWVARDVFKNHAVATLGMIGKVAVFAIFLGHAVRRDIPYPLVAPAIVDLVFAILFLEFLLRMRGAARPHE